MTTGRWVGRRSADGFQGWRYFEAMKMARTLHAPIDGTVADIAVAQGAQVTEGAKAMVIVAEITAPDI